MTREEAIEMLKSKMDGHTDTSYEWAETVRMAIQALEKEPCEDAISRQAVLEKAYKIAGYDKNAYVVDADDIKTMPSVSTEKTGQWITVSERLPESECLLCDTEGFIYIGSYSKHYKWFEDYNENIIDDVVAWMPLPQPYTGESEV